MQPGPKIGLDDVYFAVMTAGSDTPTTAPTYGTPFKVPGVAKATVKQNGEVVADWGDNGPYSLVNSRGNVELDLEFVDLDPNTRVTLLNITKSGGITQEKAYDQSPFVAMGFRVWHGNLDASGNKIYTYFWYAKGKLAIDDKGANTKKDKLAIEHFMFKGLFAKLIYNDSIVAYAESDDPDVPAATITNWFTAPVVSTTADLTAVTCVAAKSAGNVTFTFSKGSGASFSMNALTAALGSSVLVQVGGVNQAGTLAWSAQATTHPVLTYTPSLSLTGDTVAAVCTAEVKDANGVACTPEAASLAF